MRVRSFVAQGPEGSPSMVEEFSASFQPEDHDRLDVAVAYATQSGLLLLKQALDEWPAQSRWVIGLDDGITQPAALEEIRQIDGATLRLASLVREGRRFHPKLYCLWSSTDPARCVLAVGSGNMTLHGLRKNGEAGVLLEADNPNEAGQLKAMWDDMNSLAVDLNQVDLGAYTEAYQAARQARRRQAQATPQAIVQAEDIEPTFEGSAVFDGDPSAANLAWTEGASPSAGGRDLEFPKPIMPFFGLDGSPTTKRFRTPRGTVYEMTFTERLDNQMWRLLFSGDAIEDTIGRTTLRPIGGGNRSDLAIIFTNSEGDADYDLQMVVIGSDEHEILIARSQAVGGLKRTRNPGGRYYGFF